LTRENVFPRAVKGEAGAGTRRLDVRHSDTAGQEAFFNQRQQTDLALYVGLSPEIEQHVAEPDVANGAAVNLSIFQRPKISAAHQLFRGQLEKAARRGAVDADDEDVVRHFP
jgi:hypothetical protein